MTKQQFAEAFRLAKTEQPHSDLKVFDGCGLPDFQPVTTTLRDVAALINWQALQFNGEYDTIALDEVAYIARKRFIIAG